MKVLLLIMILSLIIHICNAQINHGFFKIVKPDTITYLVDDWDAYSKQFECKLPILKKTYYKDPYKYVCHKLSKAVIKYIRQSDCYKVTDSIGTVSFVVNTKGEVASVSIHECLYKCENDIQNAILNTSWQPGQKDGNLVCTRICISFISNRDSRSEKDLIFKNYGMNILSWYSYYFKRW